MTDKNILFQKCREELDARFYKLEKIFSSLSSAAESESKSTAGDKHETGRAMIQLEQEKIGKQLKELREQRGQLNRLDISPSQKIKGGSLVITDKGEFFIAGAIGKIGSVMVISPASPLGKKLMGLSVDASVEINGNKFNIKGVE